MKAIRVSAFGAPEVLQIAEVSDPIPEQDQILVEVHAAGVNPVDTYIRSGVYARLPELPYTPGLDGAGVIGRPAGGEREAEGGEASHRGSVPLVVSERTSDLARPQVRSIASP